MPITHKILKGALSLFFICLSMSSFAQLGKLLKKVDSNLSSNQKSGTNKNANLLNTNLPPTNLEIQAGLKQALQKGLTEGVNQVSVKDGFLKNLSIKLLFPPEARKMESTLRELGFNHICDDVIESMNHSAEEASKKATPIFLSALNQMSFKDVNAVLNGKENAATEYFQKITSDPLRKAFRPQVDSCLNKVNANAYWTTATTTYNKVPFVKKINTDLGDYVTSQTLNGLFFMIAQEELKIRKDFNARTSPLLKKVFGFADTQK